MLCAMSKRESCSISSGKSWAFTLLEVLLALLVVVAVVSLGKKLIVTITENAKAVEEAKVVDGKMYSLLSMVKADLGSIVMASGQQPTFEICEKSGNKGIEIFFLTTNSDERVTSAVKYDVCELDFGNVEVTRTALNAAATLAMRGQMGSNSSLKKFFDCADPTVERVHTFGIRLSDFKVRAGVRGYDGNIVSTYPNAKMVYVGGSMAHEKAHRKSVVTGDLLFFDVTIRALVGSDAMKFDAMKKKDPAKAREFLFQCSRKSFARIVANSSSFS
jgi:type II secretory pathway pseudopilin PulG